MSIRPNGGGGIGRAPGMVYTSLVWAMVLVLSFVLLKAPRESVPTIAEIAPQAAKQITDPPPEQAVDFGRGPGVGGSGNGDGRDDGDPGDQKLDEKGIEVARIRRCVGDPPRQIEDPQSPPCVPYWPPDADNGGDTAPGIVNDEIRVAAPGGSAGLNRAMEDFFNARFEFYGRRIKLVDTSADRRQDDPVQDQIAAASNAKQLNVFASTDYWYHGGLIYNRELARRKIIGVSYQSVFTEAELASMHPYVWQYPMTTEAQLSLLGEWICRRVGKGRAAYAGDLLAQEQRTLGLVVFEDYANSTDPGPLRNELGVCDMSFAEHVTFRATDTDRTAYVDAILKLKDADVTTVVCVCDSEPMGTLMKNASSQQYIPEWITPGYTENEHVWIKRTYPREQAEHQFGLMMHPMHRLPSDDPWVWAATEVDQGTGWDRFGNESSYSRQSFWHPFYRSLLLIASGIQLAGPNLTAASFARALQTTRFPNPDHPIKAGSVGFEAGSHSMTKDASEWWWDANTVGPYGTAGFSGQGAGTMCFVSGGARRTFGRFPKGRAPLFGGSCASGDDPAGSEG